MIDLDSATGEDTEALLGMMERFYAEERYPFDRARASSALAPLLADPSKGRVWILREDGKPVGYVVLTLGWSLEYHGRDAFVDELFIEPSCRGRGLSKLALGILEDACGALSVEALHLEVERDNAKAMELYRKRGFADSGRLLMTKRLASSDPGASS